MWSRGSLPTGAPALVAMLRPALAAADHGVDGPRQGALTAALQSPLAAAVASALLALAAGLLLLAIVMRMTGRRDAVKDRAGPR